MKYLIRSVKYFFYFAFLTTAIILALVLIGAVDKNIDSIFEGGYNALWKMAIFFSVVAAAYPSLAFIRRDIPVKGDFQSRKDEIISFMKERQYDLESENAQTVTFRYRSAAGKLTRMYEDRITLTVEEDGFTMEGLRKDVFRLAASLEYRLNPQQES